MELTDKLTDRLYLGKVMCEQKCPMQYYWQHHLHLQPKSKPDYLSFGSNFHKVALELGLVYGFPIAEAVLGQRIDLAKQLGWKEDEKTLTMVNNLSSSDRELMLLMLDAFSEKVAQSSIRNILGVEKTVQYDISKMSSFFKTWCIKCDFVFEDYEGLWVGDLKTTSGYGASTAKYYHSSPQTKTYFYIAQKMMPNLRGTKIFVVTKQKVRCEVEPIYITERDMWEAELFISESVEAMERLETKSKGFQIGYARHMTHCLNFLGQECPYIPICIKQISSQQYLEDLLANWYEFSSPDDHLELD